MKKDRSRKMKSVLSLVAVTCFVTLFMNGCSKTDDFAGDRGGGMLVNLQRVMGR